MKTPTPQTNPGKLLAISLLTLHEGACSVLADSPAGHAFAGMATKREVTIRLSATPGYIDVYRKGFVSRFSAETEPLAH